MSTIRIRRDTVRELPLERASFVDFHDVRPWRSFRWHKGQAHYPGLYWSATMRDHVGYESRLELASRHQGSNDGRKLLGTGYHPSHASALLGKTVRRKLGRKDTRWHGPALDPRCRIMRDRRMGGRASPCDLFGGIHFLSPIEIGIVVEVNARIIHATEREIHVSTRVSSAPVEDPVRVRLTTVCTTVLEVDVEQESLGIRDFVLRSDEDVRLNAHARRLIEMRKSLPPLPAWSAVLRS